MMLEWNPNHTRMMNLMDTLYVNCLVECKK